MSEYQPRVLSSFVRNQLVDEVYLPLIGDNLAKQLGAAGSGKRTDQMGLLLLISPPGYGKTTLMEYVADRLGLLFVKVNGPSLGHAVTSLDPAEAPNATARQEVEKISFALEAGTNVLLYVDDIQHTSPELLQKFVSLCDGQRRMEVYGRAAPALMTCAANASPCAWPATRTRRTGNGSGSRTCSRTALTCGIWETCSAAGMTCSR